MHTDCPPDDETVVLDLANARVWRDGQPWPLRAKDGAVLRYLAAHPGELVSKATLLEAVWGETHVVEAVIKDSIARLRRALGDTARTPRFIETVHGRGYRLFRALPLRPAEATANGQPQAALPMPPAWLVGRETALQQLHAWLEVARQGQRQVGLISGEAGLGKTAVVDAFVAQMVDQPDVQVLRGQCVTPYGQGEAYLPLFEALHALCRGPQAEDRLNLLRRYAPSWLLHLPGLLSPSDRETLQRQSPGASRARMQREMAEALEAMAAARCVVLVLKDLHWSDIATLDLLGLLAQRRTPARVLLLGTLRLEAILSGAHPLHTLLPTLQRLPQVGEFALEPLTEDEVGTYLATRLPAAAESQDLTQELLRRTEGHPLFLVTLVGHLLRQGAFDGKNGTEPAGWRARLAVVPATIRAVTVQQYELCSRAERRLLAVASVAGLRFSAATVAAGLDAGLIETEGRCAGLARRELFLRDAGEALWPDGTVATQYGFRHALYQQVLYNQLPAAQRVQLHRRIAEREEQGYGEQASAIAARLALHFERGRDTQRAIRYHREAAERATHRYANAEAITHCRQGLALLTTLPETAERYAQELDLQMRLGQALMTMGGQGTAEVEPIWHRAQGLCLHLADAARCLQVLYELALHYRTRGAYQQALETGQQLLSLAQELDNAFYQAQGHDTLGRAFIQCGALVEARNHLECALSLYARHLRQAPVADSEVSRLRYRNNCLGTNAAVLLPLGYADQAWQHMQEAIALGQDSGNPRAYMWALQQSLHLCRAYGKIATLGKRAETVIDLCNTHGFRRYWAMGTIWLGWAEVMQGQVAAGTKLLEQALVTYRETGSAQVLPGRLALLAEAYAWSGRIESAQVTVTEALTIMERTDQRVYESRLYRLQGELLLKADGGWRIAEWTAEDCLQKALDVARQQRARMRELQAATSLSRWWQAQGKHQEAHDLLAPVYGWFTEGFDTVALKKARLLLDELA